MANKKSKSSLDQITQKRLEIGKRIYQARKDANYSQQKLADELSKKLAYNHSNKDTISAQSISYWENGTFLPSTENLILLSEVLGVSVSSLVEDREPFKYKTQKIFYDINNTYNRIYKDAFRLKLKNTLAALPYAKKAYAGYNLKNADIPFFSHPLTMASHLLAMDILDDDVIAATLLHDVIEDCCIVKGQVMPQCVADQKNLKYRVVKESDLPVDADTAKLVRLMTKGKSTEDYFYNLKSDPKAALIKLVDRANNISKMAWGLSHKKIHEMIDETEEYVIPLLNVLKKTQYDNAQFLLSYQIKTTLDIYKRLM